VRIVFKTELLDYSQAEESDVLEGNNIFLQEESEATIDEVIAVDTLLCIQSSDNVNLFFSFY
jgi:hypothetical protein